MVHPKTWNIHTLLRQKQFPEPATLDVCVYTSSPVFGHYCIEHYTLLLLLILSNVSEHFCFFLFYQPVSENYYYFLFCPKCLNTTDTSTSTTRSPSSSLNHRLL